MAKGDKFLELENYFRLCSDERISLTFNGIERILGFSLSPSAYNYVAYWYADDAHTFPKVWINAGYKLESLDLKGKVASFIKVNDNISTPKPKIKFIDYKNPIENIKINFAIEEINKYFGEINKIANARYKSWEHCYKFFKENKQKGFDESIVDTLCLHLAFYLASWGMYRGSSFLLQKDYKVHHEAILEILKEKYKPLWSIKCEDILKDDKIELIFNVTKELKRIYIKKREDIDGYKDVSDILITKILLGTFGCIPAYDRFFISGVKTYKVANGNYNEKSIKSLAQFYVNNNDKFEKCRTQTLNNEIEYPQMKLIDMCFWQIGYDKSNEAEKKKYDEI